MGRTNKKIFSGDKLNKKIDTILCDEIVRSFKFFQDFSNNDPKSPGFGLTVDRSNNLDRCSIAAVGFRLTSLVIGCERNLITYEEAEAIVLGTLNTLYNNVDHLYGFFAHFVDIKTGKRQNKCEYSTIDTALCLEGILTVQSYFQNCEIDQLADLIIKRVDYKKIIFDFQGKPTFYMSINPDKGGDYTEKSNEDGFIWHWDHFAEQLMMYQHLAFSDENDQQLVMGLYNGFTRNLATINNHDYIYSPGGSLFIYQFQLAWFDYQKYLDPNGFDLFANSQQLIKENYLFCQDNNLNNGLSEKIWGLAAGDTPDGYRVYGGPPKKDLENFEKEFNGTYQQYAILASLPLQPEIVKDSISYLVENYPESFGEYGFSDGMNFSLKKPWFCPNYLGIDKGISLIMIDNYYHQTTWKYYIQNKWVKKAIKKMGYQKK